MLIAVLTAGFVSAQQLFVGGGIGVSSLGGKWTDGTTTVSDPSVFSFQLSPKVGYYVSDDLAIGVSFGFGTASTTIPKTQTSDEIKISATSWMIGAFGRYRLAGTGDLSLWAEAGLGYGGISGKRKEGATTIETDPTNVFSIGILPVLSYDLSDKLSIEVSSNFLRLGFESVTEYYKKGTSDEEKETSTNFGLGLNSGTGAVSVGLVFKF